MQLAATFQRSDVFAFHSSVCVNQHTQTFLRKSSSAVPKTETKKQTKNDLTWKIQLAATVPVTNLALIMQSSSK